MQDTVVGDAPAPSSLCDDIDIHEPEFTRNPYPIYEQLRSECPVAHGSRYGEYWLLTRYADVRDSARDWRTYTSSVVGVTAIPIITPRSEPQLPIELDPPEHSVYRAIVNPVFSLARVEQLRPRIREIAEAYRPCLSRSRELDTPMPIWNLKAKALGAPLWQRQHESGQATSGPVQPNLRPDDIRDALPGITVRSRHHAALGMNGISRSFRRKCMTRNRAARHAKLHDPQYLRSRAPESDR